MNKGFTLIELMVAVAIFSVLAVSLGATLRSGLSVWKKGEDATALNQEARIVLSQIARELRHMTAFPGGALQGAGDKIEFYTLKTDKEIVYLTYKPAYVDVDEGKSMDWRLQRIEKRFRHGLEHKKLKTEETVTSFPTEIHFEYAYAPAMEDDSVRWEPQWKDKESYPAAVRVTFSLHKQEDSETPMIFVKTCVIPTGLLVAYKG